ncbi:unnamed protein product [Rhodiola kirilowii]
MSMVGEMNYFLGLQVIQKNDGIFISQSKYANNLIKKFDLKKASHKRTPTATHLKITKDYAGTKVDQIMYRMKRIIKYVCGTVEFGIWYTKDTNPYLVGYCDADWAGNAEDRKSTSGGCFFLGNNLVSWFSKKQNSISLSTAEAEYIATGSCCTQLLWMKQMLSEYRVEQKEMTLYCDNMSAISISKNPVHHSKTKHIDIRHHFIRELVEQKVVTLKHVTTDKQLADIFTKPLDATQFETLRSSLGLCVVKN